MYELKRGIEKKHVFDKRLIKITLYFIDFIELYEGKFVY